jgi:hemolysin activation/secretion protein
MMPFPQLKFSHHPVFNFSSFILASLFISPHSYGLIPPETSSKTSFQLSQLPQPIEPIPIDPLLPSETRPPEPLPIPESLPSPEEPPTTPPPPIPPPQCVLEGDRFYVKEVTFSGNTAFSDEELRQILLKTAEGLLENTIESTEKHQELIETLEGKNVTKEQLEQAVQSITALYIENGYLNSIATCGAIENDIFPIIIVEGTIPEENITIEGTTRLKRYIKQRLLLGIGTPLNIQDLENQLKLLNRDPLFKQVTASLRAPEKEGQEPDLLTGKSELIVTVIEANPLSGNLGVDNYSPPSIGSERLIFGIRYLNLSGLGDRIYASYRPRFQAFTDTYRVEGGYEVPLNPMNGTLSFNTLIEQNRVVNGPPSGIEELNINGNSQRYSVNFRQPFIRTPQQEFALSWGFRYYQGRTFVDDIPQPFGFGPNQKGITRTSVFTFGQDYTFRDRSGVWGVRSQFRFGVDVFDATLNPSPVPDGQFFSWLFQGQRVQAINPNNFLILQLDLQLTPNTLLSSEQFVIGGAQSVRGYRQNILAGDNGFRFSIEDRIALVHNQQNVPVFSLAPFFDMGAVWNTNDNPNQILADHQFIAGLGLGFIFQPFENLNIRLDYAPPLIDLNTRGQNIQDNGFYFSINYSF